MLGKDISNIIYFVQAGRINPTEPGSALFNKLDESKNLISSALLVYDFEANKLFYANEQACTFLGIENHNFGKYGESFLESVLHPVSYQLLQYNTRFTRQKPWESFDGVYCLRTERSKCAWIYGSARVASFNAYGVPKLVYVCFLEVEKAMECYLKILHGSSNSSEESKPLELLSSLKSREIEMLSLITAECTSKEIADKLNLTQAAVDAARKRLIKKLGVKSVAGLVKVAISLGICSNGSGAVTRSMGRDIRSISIASKINPAKTADQ